MKFVSILDTSKGFNVKQKIQKLLKLYLQKINFMSQVEVYGELNAISE